MKVLDLGQKSYAAVLELQKSLVEEASKNPQFENTLILVEHDPVYTAGRSTKDEKMPSEIKVRGLGSVPVFEIERGGKYTFHGPRQLVGYPIFRLTHKDLRAYLRDMERTLMNTINEETGLTASPSPETLILDPGQLQTGVWVRDRKVASIGIAVKHWVSYHGFALNVGTDLRYFDAIQPCGFDSSVMSSIEKELIESSSDYDYEDIFNGIKARLIDKFKTLSDAYESFATREVENSKNVNAAL